MTMHTTEQRATTYYGKPATIQATYGWHKIGDQDPYWSVTAVMRDQYGREEAGGCMHEEVANAFPALAHTIKWHLSGQTTGPMHYIANAVWWWEHYMGARVCDRYLMAGKPGMSSSDIGLAHFKSTVVFGALPDDVLPPLDTSIGDLKLWMQARLPRLIEAMRSDCKVNL